MPVVLPTAHRAFADAFGKPSTPRSEPYKRGVRDALGFRLDGAPAPRCPYPLGTAQADAYFAGVEEGHGIFRRLETAPAA